MSHLLDPSELKYDSGSFRTNLDRDFMRIVSCHYTDRQIRFMNKLVEKQCYPNRAELLRDALGYIERFYANIWHDMNGDKKE